MFTTKLMLCHHRKSRRYFWFSLIEYNPDYVVLKKCNNRNGRIQTTVGLLRLEHDNVIHFSAIPWLNFTSLSHARSYMFLIVVPKIFWQNDNGRWWYKTMAMSIHVHHGLIDFATRSICWLFSRNHESVNRILYMFPMHFIPYISIRYQTSFSHAKIWTAHA
jgi:chloramphenicol O-acetyltransferase